MLPGILRLKDSTLRMLVMAFLAGISGASLAQQDVCVPAVGGLTGAPTIDGLVEGDPGWNGAVRVNLKEANGTTRVGSTQLVRDGGFLYISFEVEGTPTPGFDDLVVLAFSTSGIAAQDWRVHVHPFTSDDVDGTRLNFQNDVPRLQNSWRHSGTWNSNAPAGTANNPTLSFIGETKVSRNGNNWAMEMKIPTSSNSADAGGNTRLYIPASGTFRLYANVLSTFELAPPGFTQDPWPQAAPMLTATAMGSGGDLAANRTPAPGIWGTMAFNVIAPRTCNSGVYLAWNGTVGVRQTPTGSIGYTSRTGPGPFKNSLGNTLTTPEQCEAVTPQGLGNNDLWPVGTVLPNNYFVAKPGNDGGASAGRVYVKFYVAPWGIPGAFDPAAPNAYWQPLGELYQPTGAPVVHSTPEATIPTDASGGLANPLSTPSWQLSYKQACVYTKSSAYGIQGHHCIQAEVHSNDPTVVIRNKSIQINHNFMEASVALRDAKISVRGRGRRPADQANHEMILFSHSLIQTVGRDGNRFYPGAIKADVAGSGALATRAVSAPLLAVPSQFRALGPVPAELYPKGIAEGMTVITNAYLKASDSMIIGSKRYRYAQYVGGFSYFAGHATQAANWTESLALADGAAMKGIKGTPFEALNSKALQEKSPKALGLKAYSLQIPEEGTVTLAVRAEAQEEGKPQPPQSDESKCGCGDPKCQFDRKTDAGSTMIAGLFLVGGLGVGGVAFVRRRKPKREKSEENGRQS